MFLFLGTLLWAEESTAIRLCILKSGYGMILQVIPSLVLDVCGSFLHGYGGAWQPMRDKPNLRENRRTSIMDVDARRSDLLIRKGPLPPRGRNQPLNWCHVTRTCFEISKKRGPTVDPKISGAHIARTPKTWTPKLMEKAI